LPKDLPLQSLSIYIAQLSLETLKEKCLKNQNIWLKWPNDLYISNLKFGGIVTNVIRDIAIIGIGINLINVKDFGNIQCNLLNKNEIINAILNLVDKNISWNNIFEIYKKDFFKSKDFLINIGERKFSLYEASLNSDGSIIISGEKLFSMR
jgi:BirA family biotin operon repressor/biotin-[acetyl-CoA-carboxylase] ligase